MTLQSISKLFGQVNGRKRREVREDNRSAWNIIKDFFEDVGNTVSDIKARVAEKLDPLLESFSSARCDDWVNRENEDPPDFRNLPAPPCTLDQARNDPNFKADGACNEGSGCHFHTPDAYHCVRSRTPRYGESNLKFSVKFFIPIIFSLNEKEIGKTLKRYYFGNRVYYCV